MAASIEARCWRLLTCWPNELSRNRYFCEMVGGQRVGCCWKRAPNPGIADNLFFAHCFFLQNVTDVRIYGRVHEHVVVQREFPNQNAVERNSTDYYIVRCSLSRSGPRKCPRLLNWLPGESGPGRNLAPQGQEQQKNRPRNSDVASRHTIAEN